MGVDMRVSDRLDVAAAATAMEVERHVASWLEIGRVLSMRASNAASTNSSVQYSA
jgi:hypothetical protein